LLCGQDDTLICNQLTSEGSSELVGSSDGSSLVVGTSVGKLLGLIEGTDEGSAEGYSVDIRVRLFKSAHH
jgi:hypothetical protein